LKARNEAEKTVNTTNNLKGLFYLIEERIRTNDYSYLDDIEIVGKRINNLIVYSMIRIFNLLITGYERKPRKRVNNDPLYSSVIKRITLNGSTLNLKNQNAVAQRTILKYERELKVLNRLINNRVIAQQLFWILSEIVGIETDLNISPDEEIINHLKADLMAMIDKNTSLSKEGSVLNFDSLYMLQVSQIPVISDLNTIFETKMDNSIFNQISIEEANVEGEVFFKEYLKFHNIEHKQKRKFVPNTNIQKYQFPELRFDQ
jgi:hypothetical protein